MKYAKGELKYYKESKPKEINALINKFPDLRDKISQFLNDYTYNWVNKVWKPYEQNI